VLLMVGLIAFIAWWVGYKPKYVNLAGIPCTLQDGKIVGREFKAFDIANRQNFTYTICVPNGWHLFFEGGEHILATDSGKNLEYKKSKKAIVQDARRGRELSGLSIYLQNELQLKQDLEWIEQGRYGHSLGSFNFSDSSCTRYYSEEKMSGYAPATIRYTYSCQKNGLALVAQYSLKEQEDQMQIHLINDVLKTIVINWDGVNAVSSVGWEAKRSELDIPQFSYQAPEGWSVKKEDLKQGQEDKKVGEATDVSSPDFSLNSEDGAECTYSKGMRFSITTYTKTDNTSISDLLQKGFETAKLDDQTAAQSFSPSTKCFWGLTTTHYKGYNISITGESGYDQPVEAYRSQYDAFIASFKIK